MPLCDVHCHILPGMDDGAKNEEMSMAMLEEDYWQGITHIAATPHYYPKETVDQFLMRRVEAAKRLVIALKESQWEGHPAVVLGAEVAYHNGLVYEEKLQRLCIGNTNYLLLEMPFAKWEPSVLRDVQMLRHTRGIIPIIAHLERFFAYEDKKTIQELLSMDVKIQMNAEYILDSKTHKKARKLLQSGVVDFIGSDSHNMENRRPNLRDAYDQLDNWGMQVITGIVSLIVYLVYALFLAKEYISIWINLC